VIGLFSSDDKRESEEISSIPGTQYLEQMTDHSSTTIGRSRKNFRRGARFTKRMVKNKSFAATAVQVFGTESDQPVAVISRKGNHVVYQVTPDGKVVRLTPPGKRNMMFANSQPLESIVPVDKGSVLIVSPADIPMSAWASAAKIGGMPQQIVDLAVKMGQHPKMAGSFQLTAVAMQV